MLELFTRTPCVRRIGLYNERVKTKHNHKETKITAIEILKAAGLNPKAKLNPDGSVAITVWASNASHPKQEKIVISVDAAGKVIGSSKYAYLLPESVGDEIRLA